MKRIVFALVACLALSGCDENTKTWYQSHKESQIIDLYNNQFKDHKSKTSRHLPDGIISPLQNAARKNLNRQKAKYEIPDGFYCDFKDIYAASAYKADLHQLKDPEYKTPNDFYLAVYGKTINEACGIKEPEKPFVLSTSEAPAYEEPVVEPVVDNRVVEAPVVVHKTEFLTPDMYDSLIEASRYCARSRQVASEITKGIDKLTIKEYDAVMDAVISCKRFELEMEVQGKNNG